MTTETYSDLTYERGKVSKRSLRPKLLKLTDVTIPHRSRKKNKIKTKDRSATTVRERIYDDPAYTEDISHLANPMRRSSVSGKPLLEHRARIDTGGQPSSSKNHLTKELHQYVTGKQGKIKVQHTTTAVATGSVKNYECDSSSTDNEQLEPIKGAMTSRVRSLERNLAVTGSDRVEKKGTQKRNSKQKRNLSLDNSRHHMTPGQPQREVVADSRTRKERNRKLYSEGAPEVAPTEVNDLDDVYSVRSSAQDSAVTVPAVSASDAAKVAIGKRFLRGEIGIKSFNYYLLKEGIKSSKKLVDKHRNEESPIKAEKRHSRSEENIYEEIFFKETASTVNLSATGAMSVASAQTDKGFHNNHHHHPKKGGTKPHRISGTSDGNGSATDAFADCEICMEQCSKDNCEYCLAAHLGPVAGGKLKAAPQSQQEHYISQGHQGQENAMDPRTSSNGGPTGVGLPAAHILEFQSYNPNNPGVYKIETTPVAITGDYNPILQFQQSSATTSTSATTTPSDHQQQLQQQIYGGYYLPHPHQRPYQSPIVGNPMPSHYAVGGSLLLAQVGSATPPRRSQQQHYIVGFQSGGGSVAGAASLQRLNTKSSSSSDSLPYHKYNTMARLEANVFAEPATGDLYYAVSGTQPLHPLMYSANRPIGGSQTLVDSYEPQIYKSDSKASILSEFSLRSSDNSQRYARHPNRRHGGRVSDSSLFSVYSNSGQRRYFGSSESRFGYDCRRCSLDGVIGMGSGVSGVPMTAPDKCSYSDNCRYECRNCDCSSNYFSSDFDDVYGSIARGGSSGIPRKTAAGTLPSSGQDETIELRLDTAPPASSMEQQQQQQCPPPLDLKQNKYAQDFFKHVNDVKRSIYQSEMQRNNSLESGRRGPRAGSNINSNSKASPKRAVSQEPRPEPVVTTLPLSRGRSATGPKPTPAPRTSLQTQTPLPDSSVSRDPTPSKRKSQPTGRRDYPSLDRLVASSTGTIPKKHNRTTAETGLQNQKLTQKADAEKSFKVEEQLPLPVAKRHHRTSGSKTHQNIPGPSTRRKDIPVPPPPSPATYSDLQELKANMEGLQDDTKSRSLEGETIHLTSAEKWNQTGKEVPSGLSEKIGELLTCAPDGSAAETDDNEVFYDARSEDSGGGILPSEASDVSKKSPSHTTTATQALGDIMANENRKVAIDTEVEHSVEDVDTPPPAAPPPAAPPPAAPAPEVRATSASTDIPEVNAINNGSDEGGAAPPIGGARRSPPGVESQLDPRPPPLLPPQSTETVETNGEKPSKTKHEKKAPTDAGAPMQHVVPTCSKGQRGNATNVAREISTTTNGNTSASNSAVELELSCKTGNTDNATLTVKHSNPTHSRALTRQDYACLDSSEAQSDDSHLTRDSITRESQNDELSSSTLEKLDVSTLPLPALPKRRRTRSRTSPSKHRQQQQQRHDVVEDGNAVDDESSVQNPLKPRQRTDTPEAKKTDISAPKSSQEKPSHPQHQQTHLSAFQQYVAKRRESLEASNRSFNEKLEARRMHYHIGGGSGANGNAAATHLTSGSNGVPTYLFGEHFHGVTVGSGRKSPAATNKEEIFLNKSGWVQVNTKRGSSKGDTTSGCRRLSYGQQNGGSIFPDNGRGRIATTRAIPPDHGRRLDLARQSFIQQHQQQQQQQANISMTENKFIGSKVEELIQRNEARLSGYSSRDPALRPGYRIIDPQLANILNERPGFLPVKSPNDLDSPITPILSPPPAFQDNSRSARHPDRRKPVRQQVPLPVPAQLGTSHHNNGPAKGMVFSRSFEYDNRRPTPTDNYVETFSRSFDGNLSERPLNLAVLAGQRERSPNFSTLTGNSPNYLTKRESGGGSSGSLRSRDNSPKYLHPQTTTAYLNAAVKEAPPVYSLAAGSQAKYSPRSRHERTAERSKSHGLGRSRKSQFSRVGSAGPLAVHPNTQNMGVSRFRSFDTSKSQRLNSCDSGARSDLSNDELDNEDGGLSEFLSAGSHKFPKVGTSSVSISPFKIQRQRSLTPDRNDSHSSSSSLRKQRSLTPESRSLTPEERRKKGSQISLSGSRQNSSSRSNTLEVRQRHEEKTQPNISRSSSSSSYSGGDSHEPKPPNASTSSTVIASTAVAGSGSTSHRRTMAAKQAEQEHRIRRSRSLQLTERSPNRTHKSIVNVGPVTSQQQAAGTAFQQSRLASGAVFPPTIRASPAAAKIHVNPTTLPSNSVRGRQNEADKARSFDFDYNNYNRGAGAKGAARNAHTSGSGGDSGSNQNLRVDRESRSLDDDFREAVLNNNNSSGNGGSVSGLRFLQPAADSGLVSMASTSSSRLRKSNSPVNASSMEASRSPQSSGSSSNNLHQPTRQSGSPQSYGTRLCDHELTYEMMRKSPIMNFRRGDSGDYEQLPVMLRNRETINSGGNSELNFMSNETRIYEHPTTVLKPQRSLRQSPGSRDDLNLEVAVGVGGDYIYRQQATQPRSSSNAEYPTTATTKSCSKTLDTCDYWPRCAACQKKSAPDEIQKGQSVSSVPIFEQEHLKPHITSVTVNEDTRVVGPKHQGVEKSNPSWTFLCSGIASICQPFEQLENQENASQVAAEEEIVLRKVANDQCHRMGRSRSLSSLILRRPQFAGMPKNGNTGMRSNSSFAVGLSQQIKAVSSPTLSEPLSESSPLKTVECTDVATTGSSSVGSGGVGLGVLQKFKRTLNNFNSKNQMHITPLTTPTAGGNLTKAKTSPTTPNVSITAAPATTSASEPGAEGGDASSGKYRFGPLIWRTSKERRKTKYNRKDKCNSGDSGIQIELEQDEHYSRALTVSVQRETAAPVSTNGTSSAADPKVRSIRRTNSAKTTSIFGPFTVRTKHARSDKVEREAPESLPTRSLSQPNGLESYGMGRPDLDDSDSDSVASNEEAVSYYPTIYAEVLYNFTAGGPQELGLERGMLIEILRKEVGPWWFGRIKKEETNLVEDILDPELGWFPKEFVRIIHCPETDIFFNAHRAAAAEAQAEAEEATARGEEGSIPVPVATYVEDADVTVTTDQSNVTLIVIESPPAPMILPSSDSMAQLDHNTILRRSAVRELLDTEVNYVKLLASICDGYLPAMSKRIDIFSPNSIRLIFSNITAIYKFQRKFLEALRRGIEQNQIAKVFLNMHKGFLCYSTYCNAYPRALIELETYDRVKDARTILENCRESENLAELPLSAHLLAPVQRICRYPLHLNEIIKSAIGNADENDGGAKPVAAKYDQLDIFEVDIPDSQDTVNLALEAMRGITEAVNEGKRHSETIARHQASFQNFKGPPLHLHSARFFLQVDATRQKQNLWNSSYTLFLFDNQLVYCKRDIIKRSHFIYKGRIFLDRCRVVNVRDGKMFGHTIKNSLRIYSESRDKWYDFSFRSANRKHRFLSTLALERQFGGKALYVSEMTGFEYTSYEERPGECSDQSDYEAQDFEIATGANSGESSVPDSPAKSSSRLCETLPKKSQSRDGISSTDNAQLSTTSTGSLGRRHFGNWFRKPKSANCTPSQSPTHKPGFDADATLTEARVAAMELAEAAAALVPTDSSSA
ncbi:uncharacterized protein LOC119553388 isoform X2 [Drosophila subpulchrella]|uniref:uncharacterized protein LOC119553388 isoform X2 n=1 Tax=Drosophila subpulchrella TaxID=1486046 RepID=UPI0018A13E82|nr:uncharacterized protein LOC119553388 isoform X2 [Drosophila subpulchrella]